jgi:DNA repair protein RadA/Sms
VFGEVGLGGELRPIQNGQERLKDAAKHGFTQAIIPKGNASKKDIPGITITAVGTLRDALALF